MSYYRCAAYPDVKKIEDERDEKENDWPTYAKDASLARLSGFFWVSEIASAST